MEGVGIVKIPVRIVGITKETVQEGIVVIHRSIVWELVI
jgi:hypothetical protein